MTTPDAPTAAASRIAALDVLRGFAVLAIFAVNIKAMLAPFPMYMNASLWPESERWIAGALAFLIEDKWRTIFTALFGAGLVLIAEKIEAKGANPAARLRTRLSWLLVFGLLHAVFMWIGDILTLYALMGFVAMLFWRKSPRALWVWAAGIGLIAAAWMSAFMGSITFMPPEEAVDLRAELWGDDPAYIAEQIAIYSGPVLGQIAARASEMPEFIFMYALLGGFGAITVAVMLAGMALWKSGFLRGDWSMARYAMIAVLGLGVAYGLDYWRWSTLENSAWAFEPWLYFSFPNILNGWFGGLGYSALIILLVKLGAPLGAFAAAGRMAFSNYIASTAIGTSIAYWFSLYGALSLADMAVIVVISWVAMLIWSPIWLASFRYGPLEWLWRSLTYGRIQPLRRSKGELAPV